MLIKGDNGTRNKHNTFYKKGVVETTPAQNLKL